MKVHERVAEGIAATGAGAVFGLMGDANMLYLTDFMRDHGGRFIGAVHEGAAVSMADGHARVAGVTGIVTVTHGPAFTNTVTALVEAVRNRTPLVVLTGDTPDGFGHPQQIDIGHVVAPTGAGYSRLQREEETAQEISRAYSRASAERRPFVLNIPFDMLERETGDGRPASPRVVPVPRVAPDPASLDAALGLAMHANRPVVLAGNGAVRSQARAELIALADLLNAPVATTLQAKDLFRGHPRNIGICGTLSTPLGSSVISESDCILAFGASLNRYTAAEGALLVGKRIVQCDLAAERIGEYLPVEVPVVGDARTVAAAMLEMLTAAGVGPGRANSRIEEALAKTSPYDEFTDTSSGDMIDVRTAMVELDAMLPTDRTVVTDVGRFMSAPWRFLHVDDPARFLHTTHFGSIGLALGTALGASVACPDSLTLAVIGDGGFAMSLAELSTAVRLDLPLVVVVVDDGAYGAEYRKLLRHGVDPAYSFVQWPDFAVVARAFGARAMTVRSVEDLALLVAMRDEARGPIVVDLKIDPTVEILY